MVGFSTLRSGKFGVWSCRILDKTSGTARRRRAPRRGDHGVPACRVSRGCEHTFGPDPRRRRGRPLEPGGGGAPAAGAVSGRPRPPTGCSAACSPKAGAGPTRRTAEVRQVPDSDRSPRSGAAEEGRWELRDRRLRRRGRAAAGLDLDPGLARSRRNLAYVYRSDRAREFRAEYLELSRREPLSFRDMTFWCQNWGAVENPEETVRAARPGGGGRPRRPPVAARPGRGPAPARPPGRGRGGACRPCPATTPTPARPARLALDPAGRRPGRRRPARRRAGRTPRGSPCSGGSGPSPAATSPRRSAGSRRPTTPTPTTAPPSSAWATPSAWRGSPARPSRCSAGTRPRHPLRPGGARPRRPRGDEDVGLLRAARLACRGARAASPRPAAGTAWSSPATPSTPTPSRRSTG